MMKKTLALLFVAALLLTVAHRHLSSQVLLPDGAVSPLIDAVVDIHYQDLVGQGFTPQTRNLDWNALRNDISIAGIQAKRNRSGYLLRARISRLVRPPLPTDNYRYFALRRDGDQTWTVEPAPAWRYWCR